MTFVQDIRFVTNETSLADIGADGQPDRSTKAGGQLGPTGSSGPTVHIVDDDGDVRQGLANLLRSFDFGVRSFASPGSFIDAFQPGDAGCLLLDIHFPGANGLDFQAECLASGIDIPVIFMTGHADVPSSVRGMKAGAVDFLTKPVDERALLAAVETALRRDAAYRLDQTAKDRARAGHATLTHREKEVLALVVAGLMNKQIAGKLGLSEITVKVHRGTMMRKMNVRTLADLVRSSEALRTANA